MEKGMEVTVLRWVIAFLPIILLIILMTAFHWSTSKAAGAALVITVASSVLLFGANPHLVVFESLKGCWGALTVFYIIFPAILLYAVISESDSISVINTTLQMLSPNELFRILTVGWVFVGFLQGVTGFGVPVAIGVPVLIALGVRPMKAVVVALLGQAWGNTFGTLAVAWDVLEDISGITGQELLMTAGYAAALLWILNLAAGLVICWAYGKGEGIRQGFVFVAVVSLIQGGGELLMTRYNTSISAFVPATLSVLGVLALSRLPMYRKTYVCEDSKMMDSAARPDFSAAAPAQKSRVLYFAPYIVLIAVTVLMLVVKPINELLSRWSVGFAFPETSTAYGVVNAATECYSPFYPLVDSGTVLLVTCLISYVILKCAGLLGKGAEKNILRDTVKKVKPVAVSLVMLLVISRLMSGSGQTMLLAQGITRVMGQWYILFAGVVGTIGTFITGSNMSSNILFTGVQTSVADSLGISAAPLLAAQTAGASVGSMIAPSKIILGTTAGGIAEKDGEVMTYLLPIAAVIIALIGGICLVVF